MLDGTRFQSLVHRLSGPGDSSAAFGKLSTAYSESHRAYHNTKHIADCLSQFDSAKESADRPDEVEAAIWFHDVVYDPKASDNEDRSAIWAVEVINQPGVDAEALRRIVALILATRHDREPFGRDEELIIDVDLSILGRDPDEFAGYDAAIRQEYAWVPEDQYRVGRTKVLESFLARPVIYHTADFRNRFESRARRNLEEAIKRMNAD